MLPYQRRHFLYLWFVSWCPLLAPVLSRHMIAHTFKEKTKSGKVKRGRREALNELWHGIFFGMCQNDTVNTNLSFPEMYQIWITVYRFLSMMTWLQNRFLECWQHKCSCTLSAACSVKVILQNILTSASNWTMSPTCKRNTRCSVLIRECLLGQAVS